MKLKPNSSTTNLKKKRKRNDEKSKIKKIKNTKNTKNLNDVPKYTTELDVPIYNINTSEILGSVKPGVKIEVEKKMDINAPIYVPSINSDFIEEEFIYFSKRKKLDSSERLIKKDGEEIKLEEELYKILKYISPSREERMLRLDLIVRVGSLIKYLYPSANVNYFGSFATDLLIPRSDIDLVVLGVTSKKKNLFKVAQTLKQFKICSSTQVIHMAKVPIVKCIDKITGISLDISFSQPNGIRNTNFINNFATKYKIYRPLLLCLKYFVVKLELNQPYSGGIGSYALSIMVSSFILMHEKTNHETGTTEQNIGKLFTDFLLLYGKNFNYYTTGISVKGNGSYFNKIKRGWVDETYPFLPSLEDPNDTSTSFFLQKI